MGDARNDASTWLVRGDVVGLAAPEREEFVSRWHRYDDPRIAMLAAFQAAGTAAIPRPPVTREHREAVWEGAQGGELVAFDIRTVAEGRFVGEAGVAGGSRRGSGDIAVALFDPDDRSRGYGTEAVVLLCAYGFDALGLHRMVLRYLSVNEAVVRAVERSAEEWGGRLVGIERSAEWAYGAHRDRMLLEVLRDDFPPHPATAHLRGGGGD